MEHEENVKMRIREVLKIYHSNPTKLSKEFNVNQKTLNSQINGETTVSASTILLILEGFKEISSEWLLRGNGDMLLSEGKENSVPYFLYQDLMKERDEWRDKYNELQRGVSELENRLSKYEYVEKAAV